MRTIPAPARRSCSACSEVASTLTVFVAHMLWTTTGWDPPRVTLPILTARVGFLFGLMVSDCSRQARSRPRPGPLLIEATRHSMISQEESMEKRGEARLQPEGAIRCTVVWDKGREEGF